MILDEVQRVPDMLSYIHLYHFLKISEFIMEFLFPQRGEGEPVKVQKVFVL